MKSILLDIDGVLGNFYPSFAKFLNTNFNTALDIKNDPYEYDFNKWGFGADKVDFDNAMYEWSMKGGHLDLSVYDGALDFYNKLNKTYDIHIVTAREDDFLSDVVVLNKVKSDTIDWLNKNGFKINKLAFRYNKISYCLDNNISVMIEDKLSTAQSGAKNGIDTVLIDRNWNQGPPQFRIHRVKSYDKALEVLENLL